MLKLIHVRNRAYSCLVFASTVKEDFRSRNDRKELKKLNECGAAEELEK